MPDFASKLGNCLTWLGCEPVDSWKEVEPDIWEDQFGVRWDRTIYKDVGVVCNQMITPPADAKPESIAAMIEVLQDQ